MLKHNTAEGPSTRSHLGTDLPQAAHTTAAPHYFRERLE